MATRSSASFSVGGVGSGSGRGGRAGGGARATRTKSVIQLSADLEISNIEDVARKMRRAAKDTSAALTFDEKTFLKSWHKMRKETAKEWGSAFAAATTASFSAGGLKKILDAYEVSKRKIDESRARTEALTDKLRQKGLKEEERAEIHNALFVERKKLDELKKRFSLETKHVKQMAERREQAARLADEHTKKTWAEAAEDASGTFESHLERLKRGEGLGDLFKTLGRRAEAGSVQAARGSKGAGDNLDKLSGFLGKAGPALLALGAITAALGVLVKMIVDADSAMKEMNRTLLDSGTAVGDMGKAYETAGESLDKVRKTFTSGEGAFSFNRLWGTDAKDHLQILGSFAEAGLTIKEMTRGTHDAAEEMERLRQATATTLTWSRLLGKSTQEVSGEIASYMEDLGLTLRGVSERFSAIEMAAQSSGFGVKRFFGQVLQATSGMSMYNVRLEEAASLLKTLGKVLGPKAGAEMLQRLTGGFAEEGITERMKRVLVTGVRETAGIMAQEARLTAQEFVRKMKDLPPEQMQTLTKALLGVGVNVDEADPSKLAQQFKSISSKQQSKLLSEVQLGGVSDDIVRQLQNLLQVSSARGLGGMAQALGQLGFGAKLAMTLRGNKSFQNTDIHKMDALQRAAFENTMGISGTQFEELKRVSENFARTSSDLQQVQDSLKKGKPYDTAEMEKFARQYGVYVDREGKRRRVSLREGEEFEPGKGVEIGNTTNDLLLSAGQELKDIASEQLPRSEQLALEVVKNTTDMTKVLEQGVTYWLEQIYTVTQGIYNTLGSDAERKNREKALSELSEEMRKTHEAVEEGERKAAQLEAQARAAATPAERDDLMSQAADERRKISASRGREAALKTIQKDVYGRPADWKFFWESKTQKDDFINKAIERAGPAAADAARRASGLVGSTQEVLQQVGIVKGVPVKKQEVSPVPDLALSPQDEAAIRDLQQRSGQSPFAFSLPMNTGQRVPPGAEAGKGRKGAAAGGGKNVTVYNEFKDAGSVVRSVNRINDVVGASE